MSDFDKPSTTVLSVGNRAVAVEVRGFRRRGGGRAGRRASRLQANAALARGRHAPVERSRCSPTRTCRGGTCASTSRTATACCAISARPTARAWRRARARGARSTTGAIIECGATQLRFACAPSADARRARRAATTSRGCSARSVAMRELFALLERVAPHRRAGAHRGRDRHRQGAGRARAARAGRARAARPFVVFDCAAVPPTLIESELFGHEKGAFTGATDRRAGVFERADGGTVLLDELGELPLELQPKLLRVLESNEVWRVGASKPTPIDVRVRRGHQPRSRSAQVAEGQFPRGPLLPAGGGDAAACRRCASAATTSRCSAAHFARERDLRRRRVGGRASRLGGDLRLHEGARLAGQRARAAQRRRARRDHVGPEAAPRRPARRASPSCASSAEPALHKRVSLRAARDQTEREYLEDLLRATDGDLDRGRGDRRSAPQVARAPAARAPHQAP